MVFNRHVHLSSIASPIVPIFFWFWIFVGNDVKSISNDKSNILIFCSMIDLILTNEFQWAISIILFEYSDDTLWERNTKTIGLGV